MDAELFQEKMDPTHRMYLCRMLKVKNLSEDLLERYAQVKRLIDRIDGHLTPGDLAMIIVSTLETICQVEEVEKQDGKWVPVGKDETEQSLDESDDKVIEEAVVQGPEEPGADEAIADEQEIEQQAAERPANDPMGTPEQPFSGSTGQAAEKPTSENGKAMLWSPGMPVRVLIMDEIKVGKIVGVSNPSEVGKQVGAAVQLTVEIDGGETVTFEENEVEAI